MCPSDLFYKINVDASWSKFSQRGFARVIVHGVEGRFIVTARFQYVLHLLLQRKLLHCFMGASWGLSSAFSKSFSNRMLLKSFLASLILLLTTGRRPLL